MDTDNSRGGQGEGGSRRKKEAKDRIQGNGGDETSGSEHTIECTDIVFFCCTPELYIMLLTDVTPMHLNF